MHIKVTYMNKRINELAHDLILEHIHSDSIIVDATTGNGHDTLFLAKHVKHVYAYDVLQTAIDHSKLLTKDYQNITYLHKSHEFITTDIPTYDGIIFNLGYLPGGDKKVSTTLETTIKTLKSIHQKHQGFVLIVAYPGHDEGLKELCFIQTFLDQTKLSYRIIKNNFESKKQAPQIFFWKY